MYRNCDSFLGFNFCDIKLQRSHIQYCFRATNCYVEPNNHYDFGVKHAYCYLGGFGNWLWTNLL